MKFYNIWINKSDIPLNRKRCIRSFLAMMQEEDSHILLSENDYQDAIKQVKNKEFWQAYSRRHVTFKADFLRLFHACHNPDMIYADTDIEFNVNIRNLDFMPGKPYLGQWNCISETSLFFVNNQCEWFIKFMEYLEKFNPERLFLPEIFMKPIIQKSVNIIPDKHFNHYHLSGVSNGN